MKKIFMPLIILFTNKVFGTRVSLLNEIYIKGNSKEELIGKIYENLEKAKKSLKYDDIAFFKELKLKALKKIVHNVLKDITHPLQHEYLRLLNRCIINSNIYNKIWKPTYYLENLLQAGSVEAFVDTYENVPLTSVSREHKNLGISTNVLFYDFKIALMSIGVNPNMSNKKGETEPFNTIKNYQKSEKILCIYKEIDRSDLGGFTCFFSKDFIDLDKDLIDLDEEEIESIKESWEEAGLHPHLSEYIKFIFMHGFNPYQKTTNGETIFTYLNKKQKKEVEDLYKEFSPQYHVATIIANWTKNQKQSLIPTVLLNIIGSYCTYFWHSSH